MTKCTPDLITFPGSNGRKIEAHFGGGEITSDGGVLLLREAENRLGLLQRVAALLPDKRCKSKSQHSLEQMLRQRVFAIALGYEDCNDHDYLRHDIAFQTAIDRDCPLASRSTLNRFENNVDRKSMWIINQSLVECFIDSFDVAPKELVLDFDATDDRVHGKQEGRFFHGYYDSYCFLPLYVFCGEDLLCAYLRPSNIDGAKHSWAILSLLTKRFRQEWPDVKIIMCADSGFCRWRTMRWCDRHNVDYILGLAKNKRVLAQSDRFLCEAHILFEERRKKQKIFAEIHYGAKSWDYERRVLVKAEHLEKGANPRFVVTSLKGNPSELYEKTYCARGEMENRIKEQQLYLYADRTSCGKWWANQFRMLLSGIAYTLLKTIRSIGLVGTHYEKARCDTIRLRMLKIGAVIIRNTRRVRILLSSSHPDQEIFLLIARRLRPI